MTAPRKLIVALDVPERDRAVALARALAPEVAMVKVGLEGFVAHGPDLVRELVDAGVSVFLDLKLHDIPRTAGAAARAAGSLGASLLTVHAAGGPDMLRAVRDALPASTAVIAVTVLTSLDDTVLGHLGYAAGTASTARRLAALAVKNGADGLVCSTHELAALAALPGSRVVPGIRPAGEAAGDQRRVATPADAARAGATWVVVGRPVVGAADPVAAARAINAELRGALA